MTAIGRVAQWIEYLVPDQDAAGSNPVVFVTLRDGLESIDSVDFLIKTPLLVYEIPSCAMTWVVAGMRFARYKLGIELIIVPVSLPNSTVTSWMM